MEELVAAICVVFTGVMGFKAYKVYPSYKGGLHQQLFSSYAEYFWRYAMKHDLSRSSYLADCLGDHHLAYNAYLDATGKPAVAFTTLFCSRGVVSVCAMTAGGAYSGGDIGPWAVVRDGAAAVCASPVVYLRRQEKLLSRLAKGCRVEYLVAFPDGSGLSGIESSYPMMAVSDVLPYVEGMGQTMSVEDYRKAFDAFKEMARNGE